MGGVLFSLRISAFLCVSVVNRLSAHIYRRGAEERRDTQRRIRLTHNLIVTWFGISLRLCVCGYLWHKPPQRPKISLSGDLHVSCYDARDVYNFPSTPTRSL